MPWLFTVETPSLSKSSLVHGANAEGTKMKESSLYYTGNELASQLLHDALSPTYTTSKNDMGFSLIKSWEELFTFCCCCFFKTGVVQRLEKDYSSETQIVQKGQKNLFNPLFKLIKYLRFFITASYQGFSPRKYESEDEELLD